VTSGTGGNDINSQRDEIWDILRSLFGTGGVDLWSGQDKFWD
jgi:hypothetical protein